jgi:drug/metabolite transporter (DMT)-like permease
MSTTQLSPPAAAHPGSSMLAGIGVTLLSTLVFSISNALAKKLMQGYPFGETVFARSLTAMVLLAPLIRRDHLRGLLRDGQWRLHLLRCACSAVEVCCYYWAITASQLADITTIYMAGPIYVTALSAIFLREKVGWRRWAAVLVGFLGVLLALRPGGSVDRHALVAVFGSLLYATSLTAVRRLRETPNFVLVITQVAALNLVSLATIPFGWRVPGPFDALGLAMVGVISTAGYILVTRGLQLAPASVVAPFGYASILFAVVLGYLVFGDVPGPSTMLGAAIIVGAGLFIVFREHVRRQA